MPKEKAKRVDSGVHIAIREPESVRKMLLESAKDSIRFLQRQVSLEDIRSQKMALFGELRAVLKEMVFLNNKLDRVMPRVKLDRPAVAKEPGQEVEEIEDEKPRLVTRSRLDELELELEDIDKRINSLK